MSRNDSKKLNLNSANTCLTDMINISIECYTLLLLNEIIKIRNQKLLLAYVIRKAAFISKDASNEEIWRAKVINFILFYFYLFI